MGAAASQVSIALAGSAAVRTAGSEAARAAATEAAARAVFSDVAAMEVATAVACSAASMSAMEVAAAVACSVASTVAVSEAAATAAATQAAEVVVATEAAATEAAATVASPAAAWPSPTKVVAGWSMGSSSSAAVKVRLIAAQCNVRPASVRSQRFVASISLLPPADAAAARPAGARLANMVSRSTAVSAASSPRRSGTPPPIAST
eukprot:scaffold60664_cov37-Phaeocystis_antarctica.AAC.1